MLTADLSPYFHLYIVVQPHFIDRGYLLAMPLGRLLGNNRYKEFLPDLTCVLELLLGEVIRRPDMTAVEKKFLLQFLDTRLLEPSDHLSSRLLNLRLLSPRLLLGLQSHYAPTQLLKRSSIIHKI